MEYSEEMRSYKYLSNLQWVWRYSCLKLAGTDEIFVCGGG